MPAIRAILPAAIAAALTLSAQRPPVAVATAATSGPPVQLSAALSPERLGAGTTITFTLNVTPPAGAFPPALRAVDLRYPANLGVATSDLGTSTCHTEALETNGPSGCPSNSVMGYGTGLVEVPFGAEILYENTRITTFMAPLQHGHLQLLFYVDGERPVAAQLIFPATILPSTAPFGGDVATTLPLIASVPEAPDAALTKLVVTLGPSHITYYEYAKHKKIPYHPSGIRLPRTCSPNGFQCAANLTFADNTQSVAQTSVPCPRR